ncbi:hypothetical protein BDB00DRAFT_193118 [Zychaea mexicana]|uniref:uncharacterized protein n=1 Tax=Zychaea mexicana TaxID=64656 RepID=UPI0022FE13D2|nr:uncharacterized protein BDB00DRAFT_193118 [Zychaea mexicana]KAI9495786.1 hypothetical protein BDB00DRAFT_193118 [Zychaea mexicana]
MNKKFPCEGKVSRLLYDVKQSNDCCILECREQKRKCDCKQPCDRCERFNLKCVYLQAVSPRDQEYVEIAKREEMRCEIKALTEQSEMLDREMRSLQSAIRVQHQQSPPMSAQDDVVSLYRKGRPYLVSPMIIPHSSPINDLTVTTPPDASCSPFSSVDDSVSIVSNSSNHTAEPADNRHKQHDLYYNSTSNKRRRVIAREGQLSVALIRDRNKHKPWTLTVKDGKMAIETFINSHSDLMARVWDMTSTLRAQDSVPFSFFAFSTVGALVKMFNTMILNKYGKTYCRSMVNAMRISSSFSSPPATTPPDTTLTTSDETTTPNTSLIPSSPSLQNIESLIMPLLEAYFRCRHLCHLALHIPTFMRLFVTNYSEISTSPVVMALCATICVSDNACCHHITKLVPHTLLNAHAKMYYDRARQLISDRFDDLCLEIFATYVFLTSYILHSSASSPSTTTTTDNDNIVQQHHYRDLAERFMQLLEPCHANWPLDESILFRKLKTYLQRLLTYELALKFKNNDTNMRETGYVRFYEASHSNSQLQWVTAEDDEDTLREFTEMQRYLQQLRGAVYENSRASGIPSRDLTVLTETVIQQQIKHATAHCTIPSQRHCADLDHLSALR